MIDRVSEALNPLYDKIGQLVRTLPINYVDETSYLAKDISGTVAFIKRPRSNVTIIRLANKINVNFLPINLINITNDVIHIEVDASENAMAVPRGRPL